jgi:hypothetical protein
MVGIVANAVTAFLVVAVLASAAVTGGAVLGGVPDGVTIAVRVAAVLAVLALGSAARLSIASGGLATADFLLRSHALLDADEQGRRLSAARGRLAGVVLALGLTGAVGGSWLAVNGSAFDPLVAVLIGACLLVRSRLFPGPASVFALAAGAVVIAVGAVNLAVQFPLVPGVLWAVIGLAATCGAILTVTRPRVSPARAPGLLVWAESTSVIALVCVVVAAAAPWAALVGPSA